MLQIAYRLSPGSNRKTRPDFFTKGRALASMLASVEKADGVPITFLCDGAMSPPIDEELRRHGAVVPLGGLGNARSYRASLRWILSHIPDRDSVYLCEDDYLHVPDAISSLQDMSSTVGRGAYVTGYDHPDRYRRSDDRVLMPSPLDAVVRAGWTRVESTTMTFATSVATLREDARVHHLAAIRHYPRDRFLWHAVQGIGPSGVLRRRAARRVLFGARPTLSTHVEVDQLAPGVEWSDVAQAASDWASEHAPALAGTW